MTDEQKIPGALTQEQYERIGTGLVDMANELAVVVGPTDAARMLMGLAISFMEVRQPSWVTAKLLKQISVKLATNGPGPN